MIDVAQAAAFIVFIIVIIYFRRSAAEQLFKYYKTVVPWVRQRQVSERELRAAEWTYLVVGVAMIIFMCLVFAGVIPKHEGPRIIQR